MEFFEVKNLNETINQRIARYRKAVGYTQHAMAAFLDKKPSTYSQEERCGDITRKDGFISFKTNTAKGISKTLCDSFRPFFSPTQESVCLSRHEQQGCKTS